MKNKLLWLPLMVTTVLIAGCTSHGGTSSTTVTISNTDSSATTTSSSGSSSAVSPSDEHEDIPAVQTDYPSGVHYGAPPAHTKSGAPLFDCAKMDISKSANIRKITGNIKIIDAGKAGVARNRQEEVYKNAEINVCTYHTEKIGPLVVKSGFQTMHYELSTRAFNIGLVGPFGAPRKSDGKQVHKAIFTNDEQVIIVNAWDQGDASDIVQYIVMDVLHAKIAKKPLWFDDKDCFHKDGTYDKKSGCGGA